MANTPAPADGSNPWSTATANGGAARILTGRLAPALIGRRRHGDFAFHLKSSVAMRSAPQLYPADQLRLAQVQQLTFEAVSAGATQRSLHQAVARVDIPRNLALASLLYVDARGWLASRSAGLTEGSAVERSAEQSYDAQTRALGSLASAVYSQTTYARAEGYEALAVHSLLLVAEQSTRDLVVLSEYAKTTNPLALEPFGANLRNQTELALLPAVHDALGLEVHALSVDAVSSGGLVR